MAIAAPASKAPPSQSGSGGHSDRRCGRSSAGPRSPRSEKTTEVEADGEAVPTQLVLDEPREGGDRDPDEDEEREGGGGDDDEGRAQIKADHAESVTHAMMGSSTPAVPPPQDSQIRRMSQQEPPCPRSTERLDALLDPGPARGGRRASSPPASWPSARGRVVCRSYRRRHPRHPLRRVLGHEGVRGRGDVGADRRRAARLPQAASSTPPRVRPNGKDVVTVEQVMLHTSGFPLAPLDCAARWHQRGAGRRVEQWRLNWEPGTPLRVPRRRRPTGCWPSSSSGSPAQDFRDVIRSARVTDPAGLPRVVGPTPGTTSPSCSWWRAGHARGARGRVRRAASSTSAR